MRGILVGVLLAIGIATPAEAAKPFNLGIGNQPGVAVGSHGEAHVAWKRELGGTNGDVLEYCRVAKGKRRCAVRRTLSLGRRTTTGDAMVLHAEPERRPPARRRQRVRARSAVHCPPTTARRSPVPTTSASWPASTRP